MALNNSMDIMWIKVFTAGMFSGFSVIILDSLDCI